MSTVATSSARVLVTGANGFIGRQVLPLLTPHFTEIHATSRNVQPVNDAGVHWHAIDLLNESELVALIAHTRPTHLVHLAWITTPGEYLHSLENIRWLSASTQLLRAFAQWGGCRVVTAGSCAEYGRSDEACVETETQCAPETLYGTAKHSLRLAGEAIPELRATHARLFHLFGPGEDARRLVPTVIDALLEGRDALCSIGTQWRDYLYVVDAAAALVKLLVSDVRGAVNIASGNPTTVSAFTEAIARQLPGNGKLRFSDQPLPPSEPPVLTADISRLRHEVEFRPGWTRASAIEQTIIARQHEAKPPDAVVRLKVLCKNTATAPACPLCRNAETSEFLNRANVPVHQNLIVRDEAAAKSTRRGALRMRICHECGFVFNAAFDSALLSYGSEYDNTQNCSPAFRAYTEELVKYLIHARGMKNQRIVEIGCGKGDFLTQLVADDSIGNRGIGFDPTYQGELTHSGGRLRFERKFYDASCAHEPADAIVCRHVIEHIADPRATLQSIRQAIAAQNTPATQLYFETPCVRWILRKQVIWDFFYEHCSLFTAESLSRAFADSGFAVERTKLIFGGQYLWLEAKSHASDKDSQSSAQSVDELVRSAAAYGAAESRLSAEWRSLIEGFSRRGGICLWGAGAKGATFANLVDPDGTLINSIVDLNPAKQGGYLPGSGHAIIAPQELPRRRVAHALLMNPIYADEVATLLATVSPRVTLVNLSELTARLAA